MTNQVTLHLLKLSVAPPKRVGIFATLRQATGSLPNVRSFSFTVIRSLCSRLTGGKNALAVHFQGATGAKA